MAEYIERQKVFDALPVVTEDKKISLYGAVADVMVLVSAIPAADVAPVVHGRWIGSYDFHCSVCGVYQNFYTGRTNYCPNCGARMRGAEDE
jgi:hypothetical protein